jgi:hypothetical protein
MPNGMDNDGTNARMIDAAYELADRCSLDYLTALAIVQAEEGN